MDYKAIAAVFCTVFFAELGDKTQLATLLFAADQKNCRLSIFVAAALALVLTSAIGVLTGGLLSRYINPQYLQYVAAAGFIGMGVWIFLKI
ncbi:MAG: TMEM165/GDT1 family protein [Brachymonas sp.]|nr:TMEM165/GDT1 family protein [Brachymonas sp.]